MILDLSCPRTHSSGGDCAVQLRVLMVMEKQEGSGFRPTFPSFSTASRGGGGGGAMWIVAYRRCRAPWDDSEVLYRQYHTPTKKSVVINRFFLLTKADTGT